MPDPTKLLSEEHTVLAIEAALQIPAHFTVDGAYAALNQALATIRTLQAENAEQAKRIEKLELELRMTGEVIVPLWDGPLRSLIPAKLVTLLARRADRIRTALSGDTE